MKKTDEKLHPNWRGKCNDCPDDISCSCKNRDKYCDSCEEGSSYDDISKHEKRLTPDIFKKICSKAPIKWGMHYPAGTPRKHQSKQPPEFTGCLDVRRCDSCKQYMTWDKSDNLDYPELLVNKEAIKSIIPGCHFTYCLMGGWSKGTDRYRAMEISARLDVYLHKYKNTYYAGAVIESDITFGSNVTYERRETDIHYYYDHELEKFLDKWPEIEKAILLLDRVLGPHYEA